MKDLEDLMHNDMFDDEDIFLQHFGRNASLSRIKDKLSLAAAAMGPEAFAQKAAATMVAKALPHLAVPLKYGRYRPVVQDGIRFFLSKINCARLIDLLAAQLALGIKVSPQMRLVELAKRFPSLHKLGQLMARNPHMDPDVKKWLIQLENGCYGSSNQALQDRILIELEQSSPGGKVHVAESILAEASVGAVIPFKWIQKEEKEPVSGVFKVLKPGMGKDLDEELAILKQTAVFFEANSSCYDFKDFKFLDIFEEVRWIMIKEVNLAAEQTYLTEARSFYKNLPDIKLPRVLPFCTDKMTAMTYLPGPKITDAPLDLDERRRLTSLLFTALVCRPVFSEEENGLFHGDPHAGNILAVKDPATGRYGIGLLDWSLAGRLSKRDRIKTTQLIQAVMKQDLSGIRRAVTALADDAAMESPDKRRRFRKVVLKVLQSSEFTNFSLLKKSFKLLEKLAFEGFVFSGDLMLFRKALFTLEGVIYDLCPDFDMDGAITQYLAALMTQEIPKRLGHLFVPFLDRPENYASMISNSQLQALMVHFYFDALNAGNKSFFNYLTLWGRMTNLA